MWLILQLCRVLLPNVHRYQPPYLVSDQGHRCFSTLHNPENKKILYCTSEALNIVLILTGNGLWFLLLSFGSKWTGNNIIIIRSM